MGFFSKNNKTEQENLLEQRHDPDNPSQNLTQWSEKFIDACDAKDNREGVLRRENNRQNNG